MKIGGSWSSLRRDVSNSWNSNGLSYNAPFHLRLTSVLGDVVEDYIPSNSGGQGSSQFPEITPDPAGAKAGVEALTPEYPGQTLPTLCALFALQLKLVSSKAMYRLL